MTSASTEAGLAPLAVDLAPARLGTWSDRLIAALVDAGVLLLVGLVVGLAAGRYLPPVGASRLVGWALATLYVGLGSSRWSGGQTAGMLLCDLVLVDSDSRLLSPARSLIRAAVLTGPFCLSAIYLGPQLPAGPLLTWSIFLLSFGILPASIFLFLVGVRRRQFFHDVLVDSFVVVEEDVGRPVPGPLGWKGIVLPALWIAVVGMRYLPTVFYSAMDETTAVQRELRGLEHVAGSQIIAKPLPGGRLDVRLLLAVRSDASSCPEVLRAAVELMRKYEKSLKATNRLTLTCVGGWNNGLLHWQQTTTMSGALDELPN